MEEVKINMLVMRSKISLSGMEHFCIYIIFKIARPFLPGWGALSNEALCGATDTALVPHANGRGSIPGPANV